METPNQVKNTPVTLTSQLDYKYDLGATIQLYDYLQQFLKAIIPNNKKKGREDEDVCESIHNRACLNCNSI